MSVNRLVEVASASGFNYSLKEAIIGLIQNVFFTSKIDKNSKSIVLELITTVLMQEVKEYYKVKSNLVVSQEIYFINRSTSARVEILEDRL